MDRRRIASIYREYVVAHGLERTALLAGLRGMCEGSPTVLYPGSFVHLTPSFYFQHVVYVDRSDFARDFFAKTDEVLGIIDSRKRYRQSPFVRFVARDFMQALPFPEASFDVLLALYAGGISRACTRYLRPGGLVLTNDHDGDAYEASALPELELRAVVEERGAKVRFGEGDLAGYLVPASDPRSRRLRSTAARDIRSADYYVFRKRIPRGRR